MITQAIGPYEALLTTVKRDESWNVVWTRHPFIRISQNDPKCSELEAKRQTKREAEDREDQHDYGIGEGELNKEKLSFRT